MQKTLWFFVDNNNEHVFLILFGVMAIFLSYKARIHLNWSLVVKRSQQCVYLHIYNISEWDWLQTKNRLKKSHLRYDQIMSLIEQITSHWAQNRDYGGLSPLLPTNDKEVA